jgi:uracil-DNA glycosylase family 4
MTKPTSDQNKQWQEYLQHLFGRDWLLTPNQIRTQVLGQASGPVYWVQDESKKSIIPSINESFSKLSSSLEDIQNELGNCQRCKLCKTRTNIVFGEGNANAELMFVGEGPGEQEDLKGRPFVGRAGQLLDKMIEAMGYKRSDVFIANVVKCRPPENRIPEADEVSSCKPFLEKQISVIRPKVIVALGATALRALFGEDEVKITKVRGSFLEYQGVALMPTYHPAYLLRNPPAKKDVWEDLKKVLEKLGKKIPTNSITQ